MDIAMDWKDNSGGETINIKHGKSTGVIILGVDCGQV